MGYMQGYGACVSCQQLFWFNVDLVPSVTVDGVREPVCEVCIDRANVLRKAKGLPPHIVHADAYHASEVM